MQVTLLSLVTTLGISPRVSKLSTLYMLHVTTIKDHVICVAKQPSVSLWHSQLRHMSESRMKTLSHLAYVLGFNFLDMSVCEHCLYGKQTMSPHKRGSSRKAEPLQLVHSDV